MLKNKENFVEFQVGIPKESDPIFKEVLWFILLNLLVKIQDVTHNSLKRAHFTFFQDFEKHIQFCVDYRLLEGF
jgi:hypothetical protein